MALLFTLQTRRAATVAELADALEVSPRTMYRDIAALQAAGVPLWTEPGRHGGVRLVEGWRTRVDGMTSREAVALFAMGAPQALAQLGLGSAVAAAHAKLAASLPAHLRDQAQHLAQRFLLDAPQWFRAEDDAGHLTVLARAVWEQRRLHIGYRRSDRTVHRDISPLGLVLKAGVWYLVAQVDDTVRTYRVGRVIEAKTLDDTFTRPPDFDLASWWRRSSARFEQSVWQGTLRIRLSRSGVRFLPSVLEFETAVAALDRAGPAAADGWTEVDLPLQAPEIAAHQLLGLGPDVEVLEPPEVRAKFAEYARRMRETHR